MSRFGRAVVLSCLVAAATIPAAAVDASDPTKPPAPATSMASGSYFLQESVSTNCTRISTSPDYWNCREIGATVPAPKALLVTHFNCRIFVNGTPTKAEVYVGHGTSTANLVDYMIYPAPQVFATSSAKSHGVDAAVEYIVPSSHSLGFDAYIIGSPISTAPFVGCTYTGRWATL
jgi:hypothetical protein